MKIEENVSLKPYNTFWIDVQARYLAHISSRDELITFLNDERFKELPKFIIGGGSNLLLTKNINGVVMYIQIKGILVVQETEEWVVVEVGAGENWHEFVTYAVDQGWHGIENLALIPGTVGGAAVQNIAAYGQNFQDVFVSLETIDVEDYFQKTFTREECEFGYRDSVFKQKFKNKKIVTTVQLKLAKQAALDTSYFSIGRRYDSVSAELAQIAKEPYSLKDVYQAVVNIRTRKLLNPDQAPTVGSFFINPIISRQKYEEILKIDPDMQCYPVEQLQYVDLTDENLTQDEYVKIPVGRLLDIAGWLGKEIGNCKVHDHWASIFTHNGKATGKEMLAFVQTIRGDIQTRFGINLESEVSIF